MIQARGAAQTGRNLRESTTTDSAGTQRRGAPYAPPELSEAPVTTLFTAKEKLRLGHRVRLRLFAFQASIFKQYRNLGPITGTVIRLDHPRLGMVDVQLDSGGVEQTHFNFWERVPA